jgi:hypothetical protein
MMTEDASTTLARLDGFLKAFEWVNQKTNHGCNYFVLALPPAATVADALADRFGLRPSDFRVEAIPDDDRELRAVFARFLFLFQDPHGDHLSDPRQSFSLTHDSGREQLLDELAGMLRSLGASAAWRVLPHQGQECGELREWCFQDDVVLELPGRMCLLHFGVSD